jgi:hypothetical protein
MVVVDQIPQLVFLTIIYKTPGRSKEVTKVSHWVLCRIYIRYYAAILY